MNTNSRQIQKCRSANVEFKSISESTTCTKTVKISQLNVGIVLSWLELLSPVRMSTSRCDCPRCFRRQFHFEVKPIYKSLQFINIYIYCYQVKQIYWWLCFDRYPTYTLVIAKAEKTRYKVVQI